MPTPYRLVNRRARRVRDSPDEVDSLIARVAGHGWVSSVRALQLDSTIIASDRVGDMPAWIATGGTRIGRN